MRHVVADTDNTPHRLASALPVDPPSGKYQPDASSKDTTSADLTYSYNCGGETYEAPHNDDGFPC